MAYFIKKLDGGIFNSVLTQNVRISPDDNTIVEIIMRNGSVIQEKLDTAENANNRLTNLKVALLSSGGGGSKEQEQKIAELQKKIDATNSIVLDIAIGIADKSDYADVLTERAKMQKELRELEKNV